MIKEIISKGDERVIVSVRKQKKESNLYKLAIGVINLIIRMMIESYKYKVNMDMQSFSC